MPRRRSTVVLGLVLGAVVGAGLTVLFQLAIVWSWFADARPSAVEGDAVPPITDPPRVRIAVAGDPGTGDQHQLATARRIALEGRAEPYDALLLLGDLVYDGGDAQEVDRVVTAPFAPVVDSGAVLVPVLGNHDYDSGEQQQILAELGRQRPWYVERVGPVRVLALDSNLVEVAEQSEWLRDRLETPQPPRTWTVVALHHPPYSAGANGSDLDVRQAWGPLFAAAEVPLVLAGHDHDYQRSIPVDGVTYVVSGAAAKLAAVDQEDFTAVSASTRHYLDLLVYDDRLVVRAIDQAGRLVDMFSVTR